MIHFTCQSCNTSLRCPDADAGKSRPCPSCRVLIHVPAQLAPERPVPRASSGSAADTSPAAVADAGGNGVRIGVLAGLGAIAVLFVVTLIPVARVIRAAWPAPQIAAPVPVPVTAPAGLNPGHVRTKENMAEGLEPKLREFGDYGTGTMPSSMTLEAHDTWLKAAGMSEEDRARIWKRNAQEWERLRRDRNAQIAK